VVLPADQGRSFVPGDGCNRNGDQQEARKTCIPGRLIIKLATAGAILVALLLLGGRRKAPRSGRQATSFKHFRMILRNILKKQQAASTKLQASSFKQQAFDMKEIIGYKIGNKGEI
jgi:hypothetical protein